MPTSPDTKEKNGRITIPLGQFTSLEMAAQRLDEEMTASDRSMDEQGYSVVIHPSDDPEKRYSTEAIKVTFNDRGEIDTLDGKFNVGKTAGQFTFEVEKHVRRYVLTTRRTNSLADTLREHSEVAPILSEQTDDEWEETVSKIVQFLLSRRKGN